MQLIDFVVHNPVKTAVGVILLVLFGAIALGHMPMQLTPEVQIPTITIETRWPGASPQEVERLIILEQEEQLKSVEGVTKMTSECMDSQGRITMEFSVGSNMEEVLLKVNSRLQQVPEYPEDADEPVISTSNSSDRPIAWFILGPRPPDEEDFQKFLKRHPELKDAVAAGRRAKNSALMMYRLREAAVKTPAIKELLPSEKIEVVKMRRFAEDAIEARFERVSGVSNSNVIGGLEDEMQVVVDPQKLATRQLTINDVRLALRGQNKDTSGGDYFEGKRRYVVRTLGQFRTVEQVADQVLSIHDGRPVFVRDVATVRHGFKKPDGMVQRYGMAHIAVNALRETGANVLDVMQGLQQAAQQLNNSVLRDRDLQLTQVYDETDYIYSSVGLVEQNIFIGGALTMIVLMIFLHRGLRTMLFVGPIAFTAVAAAYISPWFFVISILLILVAGFWFARGALVVGLAIPTSIVGTFMMLSLLGRSLNVISLAGLAFAVGMLVDNAVVVLENIYRRYQDGEPPFVAAVRATKEVWGAVAASTLTTLAVFLPVLFVQEEAGQLFRDIALAISSAVALSLVISITVIPTAAARLLKRYGDEELDDETGDLAEDRDPDAWLRTGQSGNGNGNGAQDESRPEGLRGADSHAEGIDASPNEHGVADGQFGKPRNRLQGVMSKVSHGMGRIVLNPLESFGVAFVRVVVGLNRWFLAGTVRRVAFVAWLLGASALMVYALWPKVEYLPSGNRNLTFGILLPPPGYNMDQLTRLGQVVEDGLRPYWDTEPDSPEAAKLDGPVIGDFFFVARGRQVFLGVRSADPTRAGELVNVVRKVGRQVAGHVCGGQAVEFV